MHTKAGGHSNARNPTAIFVQRVSIMLIVTSKLSHLIVFTGQQHPSRAGKSNKTRTLNETIHGADNAVNAATQTGMH
jgi:hypothetical protein